MEKLRDEGVQLKMLQTGLALMQSPLLADNEVCGFLLQLLGKQRLAWTWTVQVAVRHVMYGYM